MSETEEIKKLSLNNKYMRNDNNGLFIEQFLEIKKMFLLNHKKDKRIKKKEFPDRFNREDKNPPR